MSAEQVYPEPKPKTVRRTVYFHVSTDVDLAEHPANPPERRFSATPRDFPECAGWGHSQEGAFVEAETNVRKFVGRRARKEAAES